VFSRRLACQQTASTFDRRLNEVRFPVMVGEKNSNQLTTGFDENLEASLLAHGGIQRQLVLPAFVRQRHDFVFSLGGSCVAVEVEKANWEKILRNFLKFHIYFKHGADFAILFLPKLYPHTNGETENFKAGRMLFEQCLQFEFGKASTFERILLVGYEQFTLDGERFTAAVRRREMAKVLAEFA
jgi:hypothetical protein